MPLKKSAGNMYDWVTNTHSHLAGECPHKCSYCYVQTNPRGVSARYKGLPRLIIEELKVNYGEGKTIFIEHMNDLFAKEIPLEWIAMITDHCKKYPKNNYVFQTKNPENAYILKQCLPHTIMIGTTIETDVPANELSKAPYPSSRFIGIKNFKQDGFHTFITVEPIVKFSSFFAPLIIDAKPDFVNIGADSKGCNLPEPTKEDILKLIKDLTDGGVTIRKKINLKRFGIEVDKKFL